MNNYDIIVLGGGPGGYIAAIRAAQLGQKVVLLEEDKLGGVCLNRGCIPTKALLKSAHAVSEIKHFKELGLEVVLKKLDAGQAVKRAKKISAKISKGVEYLMKKNKVTVVKGRGKLTSPTELEVKTSDGKSSKLSGKAIILATGAHYRTFPGLEHDGKRLIGAWEAVALEKLPKSVGIIGAGAIGVEFAYFWKAFGVDVHIFEREAHLLPIEDEDSSRELESAYKKMGIKMSLGVENVSATSRGKGVVVSVTEKGKTLDHRFEMGLIAVGMTGNIEGIGLETVNVESERGFISVNAMGQTNIPNIYAIGDVAGPPLLAHAASHEGVIAAEHAAGLRPHPLDKMNIPGCTYCYPQVASVGYTEQAAKEQNLKYAVGKIPFSANGKAIASRETDGFIKTLLGEHGELLGAHIVGTNATELIHEYVLMRTMEGTCEELFASVHPHPTLGEFLAEAVLAARGRALNY